MEFEEIINKVKSFHDAFFIGNEDKPKAMISEKDYRLRYALMREENEAYLQAVEQGDLVEIADALGDQSGFIFDSPILRFKSFQMKSLLVLFLCATTTFGFSQLNGPESVDLDPTTGKYYVSNKGNGRILERSVEGNYTTFTTAVSSPHGLEVVHDTIYVCDGSAIKAFLLIDGSEVATYNIAGASFLNGLTSDRDHMLWFTDFGEGRIHSLDLSTGVEEVIVSATATTPNGIIYDELGQRLVVVNWGNNADILEYDLLSESLSVLVDGSGLSNCDGVALGCDGQFFVSSWGAGAIHVFSNDFTSGPTLFVEGLAQPSDIHFDDQNEMLASPNFGSNSVTFYNDACSVTNLEQISGAKFEVWPNPRDGLVRISQPCPNCQYQVVNTLGRQVKSGKVEGDFLDLQNLAAGSYQLWIFEFGKEVGRSLYTKK